MQTKVCTKCGREKELNRFYRSKKGKYGYSSICKECKENQRREYKKAHKKERMLTKISDLKGEEWKDIKGYEGLYQVSNFGRVKSLERYRETKHFGKIKSGYIQKEHILKQKHVKTKSPVLNYYHTNLCKKGNVKEYSTHRIVATAFIPNPDNKPYINHIDGNGQNNHIYNLEWTTNKENQEHAVRILKHSHNKPIVALNKRTMIKELEFETMSDASKWLLENDKTKDSTCLTGIIKCCKNKIPSYLGYIWKYKKEAICSATIDKSV